MTWKNLRELCSITLKMFQEWLGLSNLFLFLIICSIALFYGCTLYRLISDNTFKKEWMETLGYTVTNKMYEQMTLVTAAVIALILQFFRVRIRDQQVNEQAKQVNEQAKQTKNLAKQVENQAKTQQDDQFKKAIELLSNSDSTFAARAGAVYMLGSLGCESQTHAQSCLDMLAELNRWMGQRLKTHPNYFYFNRKKGWHSQVVTYDSQSLINHYAIIEPKKAGAKLNNPQQAKDLSKEQLQQAKESLEAEDLSRLALIKIADIIKTHAHDDGTPNKELLKLNLQGKFLCQLNLAGLHLGRHIDFYNTRLQGANLFRAQIQKGTHLRQAQMQGAYLIEAQLQGAFLIEAQLQGADLLMAQLQGADLWYTQLQGADLRWAELQGADLRWAELQGADLRGAALQGADLRGAALQGADLRGAALQGANLHNAHLQGANLVYAQMQGADLSNTQMQGADFSNTNMKGISIARDFKTFKERVSPRPHKELENDQTGILTDEGIKAIIKPLEDNENVSPTIIDDTKDRLQRRKDQAPQLDQITYGTLTQEECKTIIDDYKKAMESVPKK